MKDFIYIPNLLELFDNFGWCQESNARDSEDNPIEWESRDAMKFDLLGAIYKVYKETSLWPEVTKQLASIFRPFWEGPLIEWNDNPVRTFQEVLSFVEEHKL